ncbi:phage minor tail protein [Acetobacter pasteurianus subsp. pasteurianus LMG 1262 = NBRC 106471]|uniref:phage tail tube protein n=2 Tax=Acetobacter pasteurianus TaxID=438 RepID=UPI0002457189|nr:phage tail tube protein [Acetobacter pasteurianus]GAB29857.1 phage minor tail protein [Acetobacter pasteurianus subsp. pasteurianus LMG 1262 = NBRC 106471]
MAYTGGTNGYAAGAETNTSAVDYALETTYNQPPTGAYQALRYTDCSLAVNETESQPDEINDIPEMAQSVLTGRTTQGSISGILSVGTFEDMLAGVLGNDWVNVNLVSTGDASGTSTFMYQPDDNIGGNAGCWDIVLTNNTVAALGIPPAGLLVLNDTNINANNLCIPYRVKGNAILVPMGSIPNTSKDTVAKSGATMTFNGITNGKIGKTFTFRKALSGKWDLYSGTMINQVQITLQKQQPATISIDLVGSDMAVSDTDNAASVTPRTTTPLIDTVEGFLGCSIFGNAPSGCIQSATITLSRDGSGQDTGMGHVGACGVRFGSFKATMEITYLFRDYQQFTDWAAGKTGLVTVGVQGSDGVGYQFAVLNGIIRNPKTPISGKNQTVVATVSITANPVPGGGTFSIARISN